MLVDRTEAMETGRQDAERIRRSGVARLVLGGAPGVGEDARSGEELAGRITRLASMAAVLHAAQAAASRRAPEPEGDRGGRVSADQGEVSQ